MAPESIYFGMGLMVACGAADVSERPHMRRTALILVATWLAVIAANIALESRDPALAFLFIDAVAARVLLRDPAMRLQSIIGIVYCVQIVAHFLRLVSVWNDVDQYLFFLAAGGWLQIIFLIWGALHGRRGRLAAGGHRRSDIGAAGATHLRGMGEQE
jgi:hypothetical protein